MADRGFVLHTQFSWEVILGCIACSVGCAHCWAAFQMWNTAKKSNDKRLRRLVTSHDALGPCWTGELLFLENRLRQPYRHRGETIWVGPSSDLFLFPLEQVAQIFAVIADIPESDFYILTKRTNRMHQIFTDGSLKKAIEEILGRSIRWPLPNVWLGASVENQKMADRRLPVLLDTPARHHYVSAQPLLGRINMRPYLKERKLHWAVTGGEAGPCCRPYDRNDIISLQRQFREAKVPHLTSCYP